MMEIIQNPECIDCPVMRDCRLFFKNTRKSKFKRKFEYVPNLVKFAMKNGKDMVCLSGVRK